MSSESWTSVLVLRMTTWLVAAQATGSPRTGPVNLHLTRFLCLSVELQVFVFGSRFSGNQQRLFRSCRNQSSQGAAEPQVTAVRVWCCCFLLFTSIRSRVPQVPQVQASRGSTAQINEQQSLCLQVQTLVSQQGSTFSYTHSFPPSVCVCGSWPSSLLLLWDLDLLLLP